MNPTLKHSTILRSPAANRSITLYSLAQNAGRCQTLMPVLLAASFLTLLGSVALAAPPNVLFIAVDDMRVELGCYGSRIVQSPHIDSLAQRSLVFDRAYCQQAVCNPSRASLMTGLRPETLNIWDLPTHFRQRRPDVVTLPQHFQKHGYFTQNIGKIFHNWRQDDYRGDAPSWSVPAVMHYNSHGNDRPLVKGDPPPNLEPTPRCEMRAVPDEAYFDGRIAKLAVEAIGNLDAANKPWFLAVGFWKPHAHFNAPKKYWDLYDRDQVALPANPDPPRDVPQLALHDSREILRGFDGRPPSLEQTRALRHGYYAAISYVDAQIGRVIAELDRRQLAGNTIIVLWSDHGFHLGEHGLWAKTSNFELDARVPLMIATPQHQGGRRTRALVELLDLYPTLSELCGLPTPAGLDGTSLAGLLEQPDMSVKSAAYTWHPRPAYPPRGGDPQAMGYSMRTDRFRYTEWRDYESNKLLARELYDHQTDDNETVNVVDQAPYAADVKTLSRQLSKSIANHRAALK